MKFIFISKTIIMSNAESTMNEGGPLKRPRLSSDSPLNANANTPSCWIFKTKEEALAAFPGSTIASKIIVDPSYDYTFNLIMSTDPSARNFLMNFLNSLYYPGAKGDDDVMIRQIEPLEKENPNLGVKSQVGLTICDTACICHCAKKTDSQPDQDAESFVLEMQRTEQDYFRKRLFEYSSNLYHRYKYPTKRLGLLNARQKQRFIDASECYAWCKIDPMTNQPFRTIGQDNLLEVNCIDLRKLVYSNEVYINGKQLDITGITWLKLFGVRQWCNPVDTDNMKFRIYFPKNEIDKNIAKVIEILSCLDSSVYEEMKRNIDSARDSLNVAKNKGRAEGLAEGLAKGRDEGIYFSKLEFLKSLLEDGLSEDHVAKLLKLSVDEVQKMIKDINKEKENRR